jgi:hypothetical protein
LLQPLPIPEWKWEVVTMDFIMGLPRTGKLHDSIMVVVDKLTKDDHFIPLKTTQKAVDVNDIELLDSQIQSYNFLDLKVLLENIPSPKQGEIVLPVDLQIDDDYVFKYKVEVVDAWFNFEDATDQLVIEDLEANIMHHVLIDPIADYMEVHVSLSFQTCFLYKDQKCQQLPFHIMRTHNQGILRISPTSSQVVHLFLQLLDWLHWHFCIT